MCPMAAILGEVNEVRRQPDLKARGSAAAAAVLLCVQLACSSACAACASPVACVGGRNAGREWLVVTSVQVCLGGS